MADTFSPVVSIDGARREVGSPHLEGRRPARYAGEVRIDGWLVQPSLNLLTRGDVTVRLRAQLMDLLLCLASRPGRVFRKAELVAEVWEGRWIAESAFSRCVAELRAALGDDAHRPRVIETITKRGYRLIAEVEPVAAPAADVSPPVGVGRVVEDGHDHAPRTFWRWLGLSARRPA